MAIKNTSIVWLILVSFTIFAFLLGWLKLLSATIAIVLLITTYLKGQLVIDYFMELRQVKAFWRAIPSLWLLTVLSLIYLAYSFPKN